MKMHHRMQQFAAVVTLATRSATRNIALFVDNGENLFVVVFFHTAKIMQANEKQIAPGAKNTTGQYLHNIYIVC